MNFPLIVRPEAEDDMVQAKSWYNDQLRGLGDDFLTAVDDVFSRVSNSPELYAVEYKGIRRVGLNRFPYVVYYRLISEQIEVIAVLHGSRNSITWRSRA